MKAVLQRVREARVEVDGRIVGAVGRGLCLFVGVEKGDGPADAAYVARKTAELRVFPDSGGKMNLALAEFGGEVLAVSQFTLAGSVRKGRRPSFDKAEEPVRAAALFESVVAVLRSAGLRVETGVFQAAMTVHLVNDGPVTFVLSSRDSAEEGRPASAVR
ncbi:MAG: D-tyrosyl-tRNA(Tyr) deacylase [Candidatus Aminicenantes bacterium]|nr:D-tyrosyl-tRNA(Tyr) deacylase [Candidatus Aminicenantes bacterium]